jgi:hypothetical protein
MMKKTVLATLLLLLCSQAHADGLVAEWLFNDCTGKDAGPNGHDATLAGSPSSCIKGPAKNKAFVFNGSDNYLQVGNSPDFAIATTATYSLWLKPAKLSAGFLVSKWVGSLEDKFLHLRDVRLFRFVPTPQIGGVGGGPGNNSETRPRYGRAACG